MDLTNTFAVAADIETTWAALTDIERIAPCMPGATLAEAEGDTYRGTVRIKVGPITAKFKGEASFLERDADAHRAVLKASGRDTSGKGNANATITAELEPSPDGGTQVSIVTDLSISGKVAQFGRSALADISGKLIDQFASCLETSVLGADALDPDEAGAAEAIAPEMSADPASAPATSAPAMADRSSDKGPAEAPATASPGATGAPTGARRIDAPEAEAIDLLDTAAASMATRLIPAAIAVVVVVWVLRRRRR